MKLKNRTSSSANTFSKIQQCLAEHKAINISFGYESGRVVSMYFSMELQGNIVNFKLPARVQNVEQIFIQEKAKKRILNPSFVKLNPEEIEQAYRTAWANIRDWVTSQMALVDTEMVHFEEVFLPYMINHQGKTYYELLSGTGFKQLEGPKEEKI